MCVLGDDFLKRKNVKLGEWEVVQDLESIKVEERKGSKYILCLSDTP